MTLLGGAGLRRLAEVNHANACDLADRLAKVNGVEVLTKAYFNEFTIRVRGNGARVIDRLAQKGVLAGVPVSRLLPRAPQLAELIVVASTEINTDQDRAAYARALADVLGA
jgi:glycine dehydrogenase subunit 1